MNSVNIKALRGSALQLLVALLLTAYTVAATSSAKESRTLQMRQTSRRDVIRRLGSRSLSLGKRQAEPSGVVRLCGSQRQNTDFYLYLSLPGTETRLFAWYEQGTDPEDAVNLKLSPDQSQAMPFYFDGDCQIRSSLEPDVSAYTDPTQPLFPFFMATPDFYLIPAAGYTQISCTTQASAEGDAFLHCATPLQEEHNFCLINLEVLWWSDPVIVLEGGCSPVDVFLTRHPSLVSN